MGFALDQLARMQSGDIPGALRGRLDLGRVVAFGHSTGGLAAADFCMRDARARACANLDGMALAQPAYPDASGRGPKQPFMFMDKPLQRLRNEKPGEAYTRLTRLRERGNAVLAGVESGRSYRVTIRDATHASFSDEEILASSGSGRPLAILETVRACLLAFFNEALNGQEAPLLAPTTVENEIRIEMFGKR
jgi:predicted dienelactone hydrolase